jgi:hypothetical protein
MLGFASGVVQLAVALHAAVSRLSWGVRSRAGCQVCGAAVRLLLSMLPGSSTDARKQQCMQGDRGRPSPRCTAGLWQTCRDGKLISVPNMPPLTAGKQRTGVIIYGNSAPNVTRGAAQSTQASEAHLQGEGPLHLLKLLPYGHTLLPSSFGGGTCGRCAGMGGCQGGCQAVHVVRGSSLVRHLQPAAA